MHRKYDRGKFAVAKTLGKTEVKNNEKKMRHKNLHKIVKTHHFYKIMTMFYG